MILCMYMYMCIAHIQIHVYMYVNTYNHMYILQIHVYMYLDVGYKTSAYIRLYVCTCSHVYTHVYMYLDVGYKSSIYMCLYVCIHMYICLYVCLCVYTCWFGYSAQMTWVLRQWFGYRAFWFGYSTQMIWVQCPNDLGTVPLDLGTVPKWFGYRAQMIWVPCLLIRVLRPMILVLCLLMWVLRNFTGVPEWFEVDLKPPRWASTSFYIWLYVLSASEWSARPARWFQVYQYNHMKHSGHHSEALRTYDVILKHSGHMIIWQGVQGWLYVTSFWSTQDI